MESSARPEKSGLTLGSFVTDTDAVPVPDTDLGHLPGGLWSPHLNPPPPRSLSYLCPPW